MAPFCFHLCLFDHHWGRTFPIFTGCLYILFYEFPIHILCSLVVNLVVKLATGTAAFKSRLKRKFKNLSKHSNNITVSDCGIAQDNYSHCPVRDIKPIGWFIGWWSAAELFFPIQTLQTCPNPMKLHLSMHSFIHSLIHWTASVCQALGFDGGQGLPWTLLTVGTSGASYPSSPTFPEGPLSCYKLSLPVHYPNNIKINPKVPTRTFS